MSMPVKITVPGIRSRKITGNAKGVEKSPLVAITAYDYTMARLVDAAGVDIVLVGDSLGMVVQGNATTLPVTLDEMIYHTKCVGRGVQRGLVVADMPFLSYQISAEKALESAGRLLKEGGAAAVKLEGGVPVAETISKLVDFDIPVMGHIGMTPQSYHRMGGFRVQGRNTEFRNSKVAGSAKRILNDAKAVEEAGAFCLVVEGVPSELGAEISASVNIPTIGIGAGADCDGQILVCYDLLGMVTDLQPTFVKRYADLGSEITQAVQRYSSEVRSGAFPAPEHFFSSKTKPKSPKPKVGRLRP